MPMAGCWSVVGSNAVLRYVKTFPRSQNARLATPRREGNPVAVLVLPIDFDGIAAPECAVTSTPPYTTTSP